MLNVDQVASPIKQNSQASSQEAGKQGLIRGWVGSQQMTSHRREISQLDHNQSQNKPEDDEFIFKPQRASFRHSSASQNLGSHSQTEKSQDLTSQQSREVLSTNGLDIEVQTPSVKSNRQTEPQLSLPAPRNTHVEAQSPALSPSRLDIVRSQESRPGVCKIMNYEQDSKISGSLHRCADATTTRPGQIEPEGQSFPNLDSKLDFEGKEPRNLTLKEQLLSKLELNDRVGNASKFTQKHFSELEVIGQFNKGFIICKWKESPNRIFVIDQHAADEKNQFERQFQECKLKTQRLVSPMVVPVTFTEFLTVQENIAVFEENGFIVKTEKDAATNVYRVLLWGVPNLTYWSYDQSDFRDLLYILTLEGAGAEDLMIPKLKREMATKACRAAVKIGDNLNLSTMHEIVARMGELKNPWSCPHGRPSTIIADGLHIPEPDLAGLKRKLKITL